jgi:hypothetical protein
LYAPAGISARMIAVCLGHACRDFQQRLLRFPAATGNPIISHPLCPEMIVRVLTMISPKEAHGTYRTVPTIAITVRWDEDQRKYVALDAGGSLLSASFDKSRVIGNARRQALLTSRSGIRITVMVQEDDGTFRNEWTAEPSALL